MEGLLVVSLSPFSQFAAFGFRSGALDGWPASKPAIVAAGRAESQACDGWISYRISTHRIPTVYHCHRPGSR
jgi:hypothetical protein